MTSASHPFARQRGFSVIELMVALLISLFIVGALVLSYLGTSASARQVRALAQMTEDAQTAVNLIARDLQMAGAAELSGLASAADGSAGHLQWSSSYRPVYGCESDFRASAAALAQAACGSDMQTDAIEITYYATLATTVPTAAGTPEATDCLGRGLDAAAGYTSNRYFVAPGAGGTVRELYCDSSSNGGGGRQPLVENVETVRFRYGVAPGWDAGNLSTRRPVRYVKAGAVNDWSEVVSVRMCLLMRSATPVLSEAGHGTYLFRDCEGAQITATDGFLWRAFHSTVALRNRAVF